MRVFLDILIPGGYPSHQVIIDEPPYLFLHLTAARIIIKCKVFIDKPGEEEQLDSQVIIRNFLTKP